MASRHLTTHDALARFLKRHGRAFYTALGYWPGSDEDMIVLLDRVTRDFGRLPLYKDDLDRDRCDTLMAFLRGEPVDDSRLRQAVDAMRVAFNMAVDEIWRHRTKPKPKPFPRIPPRHFYPPTR